MTDELNMEEMIRDLNTVLIELALEHAAVLDSVAPRQDWQQDECLFGIVAKAVADPRRETVVLVFPRWPGSDEYGVTIIKGGDAVRDENVVPLFDGITTILCVGGDQARRAAKLYGDDQARADAGEPLQ